MALKKCWKLHKLFVSELERWQKLEREGEQVLSSLANVSKRVPLLTAQSTNASASTLGVLSYAVDTPALLLQKHFLAMEKSVGFLRDIVRDLLDTTRRLRGFVDEFVDLVEDVEADQVTEPLALSSVRTIYQLQEWMENVRTMLERDMVRKKLVVSDVEYQDAGRLQQMHQSWLGGSSRGLIDQQYVALGLETPPSLPSVSSQTTSDDATDSKKKKKPKKK
ncbi:hypothetical protein Poli38472_010974 [Pythium oligandrum]|uniref:Uncharacterized protein n=1 Tax=Pythium oligandrum TaxID=41045 RepID=A0A8K1CEF0_PYTOL|nr:hypothetical protein Poli38472_010974 [Pythium oligandrum]|eukprot:TMW61911.1 hypothetical protein Poli38472_010974 [Pythium oligandrum]